MKAKAKKKPASLPLEARLEALQAEMDIVIAKLVDEAHAAAQAFQGAWSNIP